MADIRNATVGMLKQITRIIQTVTAVSHAKAEGALISYDPNYRASLWSSEDVAIETMKSMICYADVMKISDEESLLLTGEKTYEAAADQFLQMGYCLLCYNADYTSCDYFCWTWLYN